MRYEKIIKELIVELKAVTKNDDYKACNAPHYGGWALESLNGQYRYIERCRPQHFLIELKNLINVEIEKQKAIEKFLQENYEQLKKQFYAQFLDEQLTKKENTKEKARGKI